MRKALPVVVLPMLILTVGCSCSVDPASLHAVNRLGHCADSLQGRLLAMDTAALWQMRERFATEQEAIRQRFRDTLPLAEAQVLGNYWRAMDGSLPRIIDDRARLLALLKGSSRRMEQLQHDLCNGRIGMKEMQAALSVENAWCARHAMEVRNVETGAEQLASERTNLRAAAVELLQP
jgi:hypothetical protein